MSRDRTRRSETYVKIRKRVKCPWNYERKEESVSTNRTWGYREWKAGGHWRGGGLVLWWSYFLSLQKQFVVPLLISMGRECHRFWKPAWVWVWVSHGYRYRYQCSYLWPVGIPMDTREIICLKNCCSIYADLNIKQIPCLHTI